MMNLRKYIVYLGLFLFLLIVSSSVSAPHDTGGGTCTRDNYWSCYDSASCTGAGALWCTGSGTGGGWCNNPTGSCPVCSASSPWNCYDSGSCAGVNGVWCNNPPMPPGSSSPSSGSTGYCNQSPYTCPSYTCSKESTGYCYSETDCKAIGANWCQSSPGSYTAGYCQTGSCPVCNSTNVWNCYDSTSCSGAGGNWCAYSSTAGGGPSGYCSNSCPTCSSTSTGNCYNQADCEKAGAQWCGTWCSTSCPTCSKENPWNCTNKDTCTATGANWCGTYCTSSTCPTCSKEQPWNCYSSDTCTVAGAQWCGTYCSDKCPTCSKEQAWNCTNKDTCTATGANWCGTYCTSSTCPTCSKEQPWNCYTESDCTKTAFGNWCQAGQNSASYYCSSSTCSSYNCSAESPWYCSTESECTSTAKAQWCSPSGGGVPYCTTNCPKCSVESPWNCYDKSSCGTASGVWCESYSSPTSMSPINAGYCNKAPYTCLSYSCSKDSPWYCYEKDSCTKSGAQWCDTYCSNNCPVCSSTNPWNCNSQDACTGAGGKWCSGPPTTSTTGTASSTPMYSNSWCTDQKGTCPDYTCSPTNVYYCTDSSKCASAGGQWCESGGGNSYCSNSCPTCNKDSLWSCYSKEKCSGAGGNWCASGSNYGYCQSYACPVCSSNNLSSCSTKETCETNKGNWCTDDRGNSYCSYSSCPVCSSSQLWNCFTETKCSEAGGTWYKSSWGSGSGYCSQSTKTTCGDGICSVGESATCTSDCFVSKKYVCGDFVCNRDLGESAQNCSTDCKEKAGAVCGNKVCEYSYGEVYASCPADCPAPSTCGNGTCDVVETSLDCPQDCTPKEFCGNGVCAENESETSCPADCQKGYCGDNICGQEENPSSCPNDCGLVLIKTKETCSSYYALQEQGDRCRQSGGLPVLDQVNGCPTVDCKTKTELEDTRERTSECKEVKDEATNTTRYDCSFACPQVSVQDTKKCEESGGTPFVKLDRFGCEITECRFGSGDKTATFLDYCPTAEENKNFAGHCEAQGYKAVVESSSLSGCKHVRCDVVSEEEETRQACQVSSLDDFLKQAEDCKAQNGKLVKEFDALGCTTAVCATDETTACRPPEETAYKECALKGGNLVVRFDEAGCVVLSECLGAEEKLEAIKLEDAPSPEETVGILLDMERLEIELDTMRREARNIADYWSEQGKPEKSSRFDRLANLLDSTESAVRNIAQKIRQGQNSLTAGTMEGYLNDLASIKLTLKEGLEIMLAPETGPVSKDCGTNEDCFEKAYRKCDADTTIEFNEPAVGLFEAKIEGLSGPNCVFTVALTPENGGAQSGMQCRDAGYAVGHIRPETIKTDCTGSLVSQMKEIVSSSEALPSATQLPPGCKEIVQDGKKFVACPASAAKALDLDYTPTGLFTLGTVWR